MHFTSFLIASLSSLSFASPVKRQSCSTISASAAATVKSAFSSAKVIPQAVNANIDPNFPTLKVNAAYGNKQFNLGNTLTVLSSCQCSSDFQITNDVAPQTPQLSRLSSFSAEAGKDPANMKYMVLYVDPDAPGPTGTGTPAALSFFLHEAISNKQPSCIANQKSVTVTVPGYRALTPLSVARHRYLMLVYRQPPNFIPPATLALTTSNFDLNGFVKANGLTLVGGNFIREGAGDVE